MNLITGRAGVAHITPRQDAMWHQGLIEMESCIFDAYENFAAEIITNNEVRIRSGVGMLQGRFFCIEPNTYDSAEIANGNQGEERIDLIVARITVDPSANTQSASIEVIQGTPAAENPTAPEAVTGDLDAGDLIADYPLAEVFINDITIESVTPIFSAGWLSMPNTRQNLNFLGKNPVSEDTPEAWASLGTGFAYLVDVDGYPDTSGTIQNFVTDESDSGNQIVTQVFTSYNDTYGIKTWQRFGTPPVTEWDSEWFSDNSSIKLYRTADFDNMSTAYNYFNPLYGTDNVGTEARSGNLTREYKTLAEYGDRENFGVLGVTVGKGINTVQVNAMMMLQNASEINTAYGLFVVRERNGTLTRPGYVREVIGAGNRGSLVISSLISVKEGDFLCLMGYKVTASSLTNVLYAYTGTCMSVYAVN